MASGVRQLLDIGTVVHRGAPTKVLGAALIAVAIFALLAAPDGASGFASLNSSRHDDLIVGPDQDVTAADVNASNTKARNSCVANRAREFAIRRVRTGPAGRSPASGVANSSRTFALAVSLTHRSLTQPLLATAALNSVVFWDAFRHYANLWRSGRDHPPR